MVVDYKVSNSSHRGPQGNLPLYLLPYGIHSAGRHQMVYGLIRHFNKGRLVVLAARTTTTCIILLLWAR